MDFQDLANKRRGLNTNMNFSTRHYGTSANLKNYTDSNQEMLKGVPMNSMLTDYNILSSTAIMSDKVFKSYKGVHSEKLTKGSGVLDLLLPKAEMPIKTIHNSISEVFTGFLDIFTKAAPSTHLDDFSSVSSGASSSYQDMVDGASVLEQRIQLDFLKQMETPINMVGSKDNDIKMYCGLEQCQSTSGQSNTADINEEALGKYCQSRSDVCRDISSLCLQNPGLLFPVDCDVYSEDGDLKIVCNSAESLSDNPMLCSTMDLCSNAPITTMKSSCTCDSTASDIPKLLPFQLKYQSSQSDHRTPERNSSVTSKFLQQVRDRKAVASQNELKNKKPLDTGNYVASCEDKIARLKEMLSKKQHSYNVDELKQVPRGGKSKETCGQPDDIPPRPSSSCEIQPCTPCQSQPETEVINYQNCNLPDNNIPDCLVTKCVTTEEESIDELDKLMNRLSLNDTVCVEESSPATSGDSCDNGVREETILTNDQLCPIQINLCDDSRMEVPKSIENNISQEIHSVEEISNRDNHMDNSSGTVLIVEEQTIPHNTTPHSTTMQDSSQVATVKTDQVENNYIKLEQKQELIHVHDVPTNTNISISTNESKDLGPNKNHMATPAASRKEKKNIRNKIKKNHRLSAVKIDESSIQAGECGSENLSGLQDRLSPAKERHQPHNKVCSKKHKNDHCIKKHKHKERESHKKDIREDLNYDSSIETSEPIYFSPDSLELHAEMKISNKKSKAPNKLAKIDNNPQSESTNRCRLTESMEKCVNFISNLPSQLSPVYNKCNGNTKERLSSTESEDCQGFDEIKGRFKRNSSEYESDDSFVIIFSDSKKDEPKKQQSSLKCETPKQRARLPSECDSEDSFVICFERDGNASADDCYGNDDVYSDSDTSSGSDMESDTESDDDGDEVNSDVSSDECETVMEQPPKLKSCLKRRMSPKSNVTTIEKKVNFNPEPKVHKMVVWSYAYRQARIGLWERYGRDAERFKQRIRDTSVCLEWVFKREHRNRIFFQRFRPLLMRAIREEKEAKAREAKRLKEEEEKRKLETEQERLRLEEEEKMRQQLEENIQPDKTDEIEMEKVTTDMSDLRVIAPPSPPVCSHY